MADRTQKINFALNAVPIYNGDPNKLSNFITAVNTIQNLLSTLNPPLDEFDKMITFLAIKNKITEKALDSIKDLEINNWNELREHLKNTFKDKTNAVTIIIELLKIQHIKNPYKLLEITKEKFLNFKSRVSIEENDPGTKRVKIEFAESLLVNNFISTVSDPYRNNLATRNPQTLSDMETLLQNDFQYLRTNPNFIPKPMVKQLPNIPPRRFPDNAVRHFPSGPINFQSKNSHEQRPFAPKQQIRNAQGMKPTPMSTQTRQSFQPGQNYSRPNNYFTQQNRQFGTYQPNYKVEEINNTETLNENQYTETQNLDDDEYTFLYSQSDENPIENLENNPQYEDKPENNDFLGIPPHIQEKS